MEAAQAMGGYVSHHTTERLHSSLGYLTPNCSSAYFHFGF